MMIPMKSDLAFALLPPLVALALQWALWPLMQPFVWFLFGPAVFISTRLGGRGAGVFSAFLSAGLSWIFFLKPLSETRPDSVAQGWSVLFFLALALLYSQYEQRLRRDRQSLAEARDAESAARQDAARMRQEAIEHEKLQTELLRYHLIVANTSDMLGIVDRDMRYAVVNPAYTALVGRDVRSIQGCKVADVVGPATFANIQPMLQRALAGETLHFVTEPMLPDGQHRVLEAQYHPYGSGDAVQGVVVTLRDITALRASAAALRDSEERLRLALEASNDGLWDWDLRSGVIYRSPRYFQLVGHPEDASSNDLAYLQRITHPEDLPRLMQGITDHQRGLTRITDVEFRVVTRLGEVRWMRARGGVVARDAEGAALRMVGTLSDITAAVAARASLQEQAAELAQRNEELERFNRATVGREMDMLALKQRVNALSLELGRPVPYPLDFLAEASPTQPAALA